MTLTQILQKIRSVFYTKSEIDASLSGYLPLSGGRMTGNISKSSDDTTLVICGSTGITKGARLLLAGKDNSLKGAFGIQANDGTTSVALQGFSDGSLKWGSKQLAYAYNNTVTLTNIHVGGARTGSGKGVYFTVPINVYGTPSITLSRLRVRCNGNYLFGSSGSAELPTQSYSMSTAVYYGCIAFNLTFTNADGVNNEAVAIEVSVKLTY